MFSSDCLKTPRVPAIVVVVLLLAGVFYSLYLGDSLRYPDEREYLALATNLVSAQLFSIDGEHATASRPPGYPWLLSVLVLAGANVVVLRFANFLALAVSILLLYRTVASRVSQSAATIAVLLVAVYPPLLYLAGTVYPQTIAGLVLQLLLFLLTRDAISTAGYVAAGLLFGYLALTVPVLGALLPVFGVWLSWTRGVAALKGFALATTICILVVGGWTTRNHLAFGRLVLVTSHAGANLLQGNSEDTDPRAWWKVDLSKYSAETHHLDEVDRDSYYSRKAVEFIYNHRVEALKLYFWKLAHHFHYRNEFLTDAQTPGGRSLRDGIMLVTYGPMLVVFVARIALAAVVRPSAFEVLLAAVYLAGGLVYAAFITRIRFRLPLDLFMIAAAAIFVQRVLDEKVRARWSAESASVRDSM